MAAKISGNVRAAASDLPVLISPPAFGRTDFLSVMGAPPVSGVVWCVHDYEPREYHASSGKFGGAGALWRVWRGHVRESHSAVSAGDAPIFLGEFGASRWAMDVDDYYAARIATCEARGMGWAAFRWPTRDKAYEAADNMFNVLQGGRGEAPAIDTLRAGWAKNTRRPGKARLRGRS